MEIGVYEGERPMIKDNHFLAKFDLKGIPPAPAGRARVSVTFDIDENSILKVSAREIETGKTEKIVISNDSGRLSKDEIEKMVKEAENFSDQDKKVREKLEARSALEGYIKSVRDTIEEHKDDITKNERKSVEKAIKAEREWIKESLEKTNNIDKSEYEERLKELQGICDPVMSKIYKKKGQTNENEYGEEPDL